MAVGCEHTVEINEQVGEHEASLAQVFGLKRFPDQSQVNRVLTATEAEAAEKWREGHIKLLCENSRVKDKEVWWEAETGERFLMVDIDQRGMVVSGKEYEVAEPGFFGSKRGHRGYQLTLMWFGGQIGEVVDEYLDGGKTPMRDQLPDVLRTLSGVCQKLGIAPGQVVIRADAQLGTAGSITQIRRFGFHYLLKGLTPHRAQTLAEAATGVYWKVKPNAEGTHHFAGAALFQFLVATTTNVLRWFKHRLFAGSKFARLDLLHLIRQVINLPTRLVHQGQQWLVQFPASHALARKLIASCPHYSQPLSFPARTSCLHKI